MTMAVILVVEDEGIIALSASMILEDAGYTVILAYNGEAGLAVALTSSLDLIISDYMMPRMDGIQMIKALREAGNKTPVILATAIPEDRLPSNPHPVYDAYLGKPYNGNALHAAVRRLLGNKDDAG